jgi:nucleoid DNA-binding protein
MAAAESLAGRAPGASIAAHAPPNELESRGACVCASKNVLRDASHACPGRAREDIAAWSRERTPRAPAGIGAAWRVVRRRLSAHRHARKKTLKNRLAGLGGSMRMPYIPPAEGEILANPSITEYHRTHMAKKKTAAKKAAPKAAAKPAAPKPIKEALSKSGLVAHISENTGVAARDVRAVLASLEGAVHGSISKKGAGSFTLPGLLKITAINVPAKPKRKGINPFTKEEQWFAAKPASVKVKVRPLKKLKDAAA